MKEHRMATARDSMSNRDQEYIARAQRALDEAKQKRAGYKGDCEDCSHYRPGLIAGTCRHPAVTLVAFNLTNAYAKGRIQTCEEQRDRTSVYGPVVCGPNGALFEEVTPAGVVTRNPFVVGMLIALVVFGFLAGYWMAVA
jgi:hypothetical protein